MSQPSEEVVTEALAVAREELDMDVAVLCELRRGREVFGRIEGDAESFPFLEDGSLPFEETVCSKVMSHAARGRRRRGARKRLKPSPVSRR